MGVLAPGPVYAWLFDQPWKNYSKKEEIEELKGELKKRNKSLKILKDAKRDIEHDLNKKVELLETKLKAANEIQAKERTEVKAKIQKANKKFKDATENEAKLEFEKVTFERMKETRSMPSLSIPNPYFTSALLRSPIGCYLFPPKQTLLEMPELIHQRAVEEMN